MYLRDVPHNALRGSKWRNAATLQASAIAPVKFCHVFKFASVFESALYSRIAAFTLKQPLVVEIVGMSVYKRPATFVGRLMQRPASKKNATPAQLPLLKQCSICHGHLVNRTDEAAIECTIVGSESFQTMATHRKICSGKTCRATHRANFAYQDGVKVNTLSFNDLEENGIDLVSSKYGFTMQYLKMTFYRFLRGNLAPGQETSVRGILAEEGDPPIHPQRFQNYLMIALEGFALARRSPEKIVPFHVDVDRPSSISNSIMFPSFSLLLAKWQHFHLMAILEFTGNCIWIMSLLELLQFVAAQEKINILERIAHARVPTKTRSGSIRKTALPDGSLWSTLIHVM